MVSIAMWSPRGMHVDPNGQQGRRLESPLPAYALIYLRSRSKSAGAPIERASPRVDEET